MSEGGVSTAGEQSILRNQVGVFSLVVDLLLRGPHNQWYVAVIHPLLPHLKGWGFQHITVHYRNWAHEAARSREVKEVKSTPGWVFFPRNGLKDQRTTVTGHSQCSKYLLVCGVFIQWVVLVERSNLSNCYQCFIIFTTFYNADENCTYIYEWDIFSREEHIKN